MNEPRPPFTIAEENKIKSNLLWDFFGRLYNFPFSSIIVIIVINVVIIIIIHAIPNNISTIKIPNTWFNFFVSLQFLIDQHNHHIRRRQKYPILQLLCKIWLIYPQLDHLQQFLARSKQFVHRFQNIIISTIISSRDSNRWVLVTKINSKAAIVITKNILKFFRNICRKWGLYMATEQGVVTINYNQFRRCGGDNKGTAVNQFRFKSQHSTKTIENKLQKLKDALVWQVLVRHLKMYSI